MAVRTRWVRYGRPAAEALREEIVAAKGTEPLAPVTVVVPSNHVGVAARRLLASGRLGPTTAAERGVGLVAVTFLTTYRLAELLGAPVLAGQGRRPVSTPVITAAVRRALQQEPGMFAPVAAHPATETALVASYRELRDVSPRALASIEAQGRRAHDVARIHTRARAVLHDGWYDEEDLTEAAVAALAAGPVPHDLGSVVVFLPQRISLHAASLLRTVGDRTDLVLLAGATGQFEADEDVRISLVRLGSDEVDPGRPSASVAGAAPAVSADRTRIIVTSDADEEVREAVRVVVDAARTGTPLDRIAVLYATANPYDRLLREHLTAAGVTFNGSASVPLASRMAGRTLLGFLGLPEMGFRRQDVLDWLTAAPLRVDGRRAPVAAWERISREAGVVAGRQHWDGLLATFAAREHERAALGADEERPPWWLEQRGEQARRAEELRTFVLGLMDELARATASPAPWSERSAWARTLLHRFLGSGAQRMRWPLSEQRAAERVELALDRLAALDELEPAVDLEVFTRTLTVELESDLQRVGRLGEGVLVGSITMGLGLDLDVVVTCGLAEGSFPGTIRDDSLLPDREREASGGELALRSQQIDRQHRELLASLAGAERQVLTVPRGDLRRSAERVPSRWVLAVVKELCGETVWDLDSVQGPWLTDIASFDAGLRAVEFPASAQEHRLRTVLASGAADRRELVTVATGVDPVMTSGLEVVEARGSRRFTRFDGNLGGLDVPSPVDAGSSATSLERWAACPFAYAVQNLLRVQPIENPEEQLVITPMDRGRLLHEVLELYVKEVIAGPPVPFDAPWDEARLVGIANEVCDRFEAEGLTGRPIFWRRERARIISGLRTFLEHDRSYRTVRRCSPIATELPFGRDGHPPVPYPLPDRRTVPMRGNADRVDLGEDGTIHVTDYKTGKAYEEFPEDDPSVAGTRLQLAIYGQAARQQQRRPDAKVQADYWFVTPKGRYKLLGYEVSPDVVAQVSDSIDHIVRGIEAGVFVHHPEPPGYQFWIPCEFCDPDGLGTTELWRQWVRKLDDPALAGYLELVGVGAEDA